MSIRQETFEEYEMIAMLVRMVDEKDSFTSGHSERVAVYSSRIGAELGLSEEEQYTLYRAGLLHDIGKITAPESILLKPAKLNHIEYALIKDHATLGATLIEMVTILRPLKNIVLHHHERYDGKGYPSKLKGEEIPFFSRIIAVSDSFDAITTNRIYRPKKTSQEAIKILKDERGKQFDPKIVNAAVKVFEKLEDIRLPDIDIIKDKRMGKRLDHFFKDHLTQAYNQDFLEHQIIKNYEKKSYSCIYFIEILGMHKYNKQRSWEMGDIALKEISKKLHQLFTDCLVFRVHGDDFIVLSKSHTHIDTIEGTKYLSQGLSGLDICIWHHDLNKHDISEASELFDIVYTNDRTRNMQI